MAIRITTKKGFKIEADTAEDVENAVRVAQLLDEQSDTDAEERPGDSPTEASGHSNLDADDAEDAWTIFLSSISDGAKETLAYVRSHPGVARGDLAEAVTNGRRGLSGYLRSVTTQAENAGIKKTSVLRQKATGPARDQVLQFFPGKLLEERGVNGPRKENKETKS